MVNEARHVTAAAAIVAFGGWATACAVIGYAVTAAAGQRRRRAELENEVQRQELRAFFSSRMVADGGLFFAPIATVHSCFIECVGTPRQGQFAPSTRALLVFDKGSVSPVSLDGLEEFSHVWVFWAFHLNTNQKDARAHAGVRPDSRGHTFSAKISPPFLKRRVGVFSTRTPHRPNPIGVSLCKVEEVKAAQRSIRLSGVDLVDGTPVLDVKPYVPDYDCPRAGDGSPGSAGTSGNRPDGVRVAVRELITSTREWVQASVKHRRMVEWTPEAELQLEEACSSRRRKGEGARMRFFRGDHEGAKMAITESLSVDVRSIRKTREALTSPSCLLLFDGLRIEFATTTAAAAAAAAGPSSTGGSSASSPLATPATGAASGTAAPAAAAAASEERPSSPEPTGSAASVKFGLRGNGEGLLASATGGGAEENGGGRDLTPPPLFSVVETVRVLSVEAGERDRNPPGSSLTPPAL